MADQSEAGAFSYWKEKERSTRTNAYARTGGSSLRPPSRGNLYRSRTPDPPPPRPPLPINSQQLIRRPLHQQHRRLSGKSSVSNIKAKWEETTTSQDATPHRVGSHRSIHKSNSNPIMRTPSPNHMETPVSPSQLKRQSFKLSPVPPPKRFHVTVGQTNQKTHPNSVGEKNKSVSEITKMLETTLSPKTALEYNKREKSSAPEVPDLMI